MNGITDSMHMSLGELTERLHFQELVMDKDAYSLGEKL